MQRGVVDRVLHMYASPHVVLLLKYILSTTSSQGSWVAATGKVT